MVPMADYRRVSKKVLQALQEQSGKAFTTSQLQGATKESYDLVKQVSLYLLRHKEIGAHPQGGWCFGEPIMESANVVGDGEDTFGREIRALHKSEMKKGRENLPDLGG